MRVHKIPIRWLVKSIPHKVNLKIREFDFFNKSKTLGCSSASFVSSDYSEKINGNEMILQDDISEKPEYYTSFVSMTKIKIRNFDIFAGIVVDPTAKGGLRYMVIEPTMTPKDWENFEMLKKMLMVELQNFPVNMKKSEIEKRLVKKIINLIKSYHLKIPKRTISKIIYYSLRDYLYLNKIEPLLHDHLIEEISCDGTGIPIYVWHRKFESLPTNIVFDEDDKLETFTRKLAYISGKHVSIANPIVDASLPDGSRINLTLGHEITKKGSTFTIRKFRSDPITIVDLIKFKTISSEIAAYLWYVIEKRSTMLVSGGTASGKTTTLNVLASFITPGQKIVSIEDTEELNLPHENWIMSVARQSFTSGQIGEITQFDLLRAALRQRPDVIIVGETRGEEAHTLFQAMATGHGGFSSIHADSIDAVLTRLTSVPMNVPKILIGTTLDLIILQLKLKVKGKSVRRITQITEVKGIDEKTNNVSLNDIYKWDPKTDQHYKINESILLKKIQNSFGESEDEIIYEINKRKTTLEWMVKNNIRKHDEVTSTIMEFYAHPDRFYERKRFLR